jgi:phosphatidate cytidylyltransferase
MLKQRIATAVVLVALVLAADFYLSTPAWGLLLLVPIALGAWEWATLGRFSRSGQATFAAVVLGSCVALVVGGQSTESDVLTTVVLAAAVAFWIAVVPAWLHRAWRLGPSAAWVIVGWLVLVPSWYGAVILHGDPAALLALLAVVWIADSAAFFVGRRFGRHRLAPSISPGKTWEGVGGAFAAVLLYALVLEQAVFPALGSAHVRGLYALVVSMTVLGILGDLFESWVKRQAGVKDSGTLLPGHGGVLDRIDALTAAVPLAALWTFLER